MFIVNLAFSDLCMMTTQGLPVAINAFVQVKAKCRQNVNTQNVKLTKCQHTKFQTHQMATHKMSNSLNG
jgi:hypothetical protein